MIPSSLFKFIQNRSLKKSSMLQQKFAKINDIFTILACAVIATLEMSLKNVTTVNSDTTFFQHFQLFFAVYR